MAKKNEGEPSWRYRRIMIYAVLIWAAYQLHLLINAPDSRVNETIAWGWQVIIMVVVLGYTGLATAQDIAAILTTRTGRPYAEPPVEPTPPPPPDNLMVVNNPPQQENENG